MLFIKYLLSAIGVGFLLAAAGILAWDLYQSVRIRQRRPSSLIGADQEPPETTDQPGPVTLRWPLSLRLALIGALPILLALSIVLVPSGYAGVQVSQFQGALPSTLYPGVHWVAPLIDHVELFSIRDRVFSTGAPAEEGKPKTDVLTVQTKEGLTVGLAVTVRYSLDPRRLPWIESNVPQPVEQEVVPPVIASSFRQATPNYMVRELFATKREQIRQTVAGDIVRKLAPDGIVVKEVMLRDVQLPEEYAKGMENLLLKEQENDRMTIELDLKQKQVKEAALEAEAQKARDVKAAEARAETTVIDAKAQSDAMQYTLPLKQKQIEQSRLEAEARKEATEKNAEAMADAKVIDSKAELQRRKLLTEAEADRISHVAVADATRMKLEAEALKENPMLIQKIIAEKLSDKVQIMMVPSDGKFFFANDVLKGVPAAAQSSQ
ncbi:MAG TPA: SPFH domain-containing protein [Bryobacteraceae bacterium]|nr:SPFH domain-containing protein [Bryobacteraceae bacterium]